MCTFHRIRQGKGDLHSKRITVDSDGKEHLVEIESTVLCLLACFCFALFPALIPSAVHAATIILFLLKTLFKGGAVLDFLFHLL